MDVFSLETCTDLYGHLSIRDLTLTFCQNGSYLHINNKWIKSTMTEKRCIIISWYNSSQLGNIFLWVVRCRSLSCVVRSLFFCSSTTWPFLTKFDVKHLFDKDTRKSVLYDLHPYGKSYMCFYKNLLSYSSGIDKIRRVYSNENQGSVSKIVNFITPGQGILW